VRDDNQTAGGAVYKAVGDEEGGGAVAESGNKWYRSPAVIGAVITVAGFGLFTLGAWLVSEWLLR
jgi:hypothetical protein